MERETRGGRELGVARERVGGFSLCDEGRAWCVEEGEDGGDWAVVGEEVVLMLLVGEADCVE